MEQLSRSQEQALCNNMQNHQKNTQTLIERLFQRQRQMAHLVCLYLERGM